jgi:hypothetical protein
MSEFILQRTKPKMWSLTIDDQTFEVPLGGSLTPKEAAPLDTAEGTRAFFQKYIPKKIADTLTIDDYNAITNAWIRASGGLDAVGES